MSEDNLYHPSEKAKKVSLFNEKHFSEKYDYSIELNDKFWSEEGKKIEWIKPFSKVYFGIYLTPISVFLNKPTLAFAAGTGKKLKEF